jgi:hypothetical protein
MNAKTIWAERQNKPTLIVRDLAPYVEADKVYEVLLRRGVFKWLSARRKLIKLKNIWCDRITQSIVDQKASYNKAYYRGYRKALEECRAEVRAICHGERWEAPDFDTEAQRWLTARAGKPEQA